MTVIKTRKEWEERIVGDHDLQPYLGEGSGEKSGDVHGVPVAPKVVPKQGLKAPSVGRNLNRPTAPFVPLVPPRGVSLYKEGDVSR